MCRAHSLALISQSPARSVQFFLSTDGYTEAQRLSNQPRPQGGGARRQLNTVLPAVLQAKARVNWCPASTPRGGLSMGRGCQKWNSSTPSPLQLSRSGRGRPQPGKTLPAPYLPPARRDESCVLLTLAATDTRAVAQNLCLPVRAYWAAHQSRTLWLLGAQDLISSPSSHP